MNYKSVNTFLVCFCVQKEKKKDGGESLDDLFHNLLVTLKAIHSISLRNQEVHTPTAIRKSSTKLIQQRIT